MVRLVSLGRTVARFPITQSIISEIPGWDDLMAQHGTYTACMCDINMRYNRNNDDQVEDYWDAMMDQLSSILSTFPTEDAVIVVGRCAPASLAARKRFLEKVKGSMSAEDFIHLEECLTIYAPCSEQGRKNNDTFNKWYLI